ncbi:hypothetical protein psyc5s11_19310 [Clostridium gelidum]|uniref:Lipoprotein n=1 Tax=Clostridium gelidum TaxID=704125 RepID=A0ABM7TA57_9CLOT|nr:hypothetical protein [Clostridium gelidum]BCZ45864.1 hypothetical protein psyc5s11_19310 [Clostridium gelidum]
MKRLKFCLLFFLIFLMACSSNTPKSTNKLEDNNNESSQTVTRNYGDTSKEKQLSSGDSKKDKVSSEENITEKIKNYIISGQENKPEAQKIKWSKTFLNTVDIKGLYKQYIANGGHIDDLESFASYMTLNAPVQRDWKNLFSKDLYDTYGEKVVRLEHLKDDLYQAYIVKEGLEIPYVVVSARTGYFHG